MNSHARKQKKRRAREAHQREQRIRLGWAILALQALKPLRGTGLPPTIEDYAP